MTTSLQIGHGNGDNDDQSALSHSDLEMNDDEDSLKDEQQEKKQESSEAIAQKETRAVILSRLAVIMVLVVTATIVISFVYRFMSSDEMDDFQVQFDAHASKIIDAFHEAVESKLAAIDALSVSTTSYARSSGSVWPNVTIPDFAARGANSRILSDGLSIYWTPLITNATRSGWEAYTIENNGWLDEQLLVENDLRDRQDLYFETSNRQLSDQIDQNGFIPVIHNFDGPVPEGNAPFYFPLWQMTPVIPFMDFMNFDMMSHSSSKGSFELAYKTKEAAIDIVTNMLDTNDDSGTAGQVINLFLQKGQYRHSTEAYQGDPISTLSYPVFDDFSEDRQVVGLLSTHLYWRLLFKDILPPNAEGIICVLENNFNQTFSYQIDGRDATFIGSGDKHDSKYDSYEVSAEVTALVRERAHPVTRAYTTVELNNEYCNYTLRVFPSDTTKTTYVTDNPIHSSVVVGAIFAFTALVFLTYDCLVERRQNIVLTKAVQSGAIVSSLFPEVVRDRLFEEKEDKDEKKHPNGWKAGGNIRNLLSHGAQTQGEESEAPVVKASRPIAERYSNCTVYFADLAGFTAWSNSRSPEDVFTLLETLYAAFDAIAVKRGVFKVETIGDCYMAVTGLPEPAADHAVKMAKFARDCMAEMGVTIAKLKEHLGEDTGNLGFRVGLHSGPVTAGVLRGQKARFQLFGDTVNTASRMESNGVVGRIHVSQSTADELAAAGKSHWLTPRDQLVQAKGLGSVQTYFVNLSSEKSMTTTRSGSMDTAGLIDEDNLDWSNSSTHASTKSSV